MSENGLNEDERMRLIESIRGNIVSAAEWICARYKCPQDFDDCIQEGTLRAWRLSGIYIPNESVPFRGFCMANVKHAMINWILYHGKVVHIPTTAVGVFEQIWADALNGDTGETIVEAIPAPQASLRAGLTEEDLAAIDSLLTTLSPIERQVLDLFIEEGLSPKEIGARISIGYTKARNALYAAIAKMRKGKFKPVKRKAHSDKYGITKLVPGQTIRVQVPPDSPVHNCVRYFKKRLGWNLQCKKRRNELYATITRIE